MLAKRAHGEGVVSLFDRPWTQSPWSLGCCDDCDRPWVIETARGRRCAIHHAADKAHARTMHPAGAR